MLKYTCQSKCICQCNTFQKKKQLKDVNQIVYSKNIDFVDKNYFSLLKVRYCFWELFLSSELQRFS